VALGVCSRYSGATVPDSHRVPRHLTALIGGNFPAGFKERFISTPNNLFSKLKLSGLYADGGLLIGCRQ